MQLLIAEQKHCWRIERAEECQEGRKVLSQSGQGVADFGVVSRTFRSCIRDHQGHEDEGEDIEDGSYMRTWTRDGVSSGS